MNVLLSTFYDLHYNVHDRFYYLLTVQMVICSHQILHVYLLPLYLIYHVGLLYVDTSSNFCYTVEMFVLHFGRGSIWHFSNTNLLIRDMYVCICIYRIETSFRDLKSSELWLTETPPLHYGRPPNWKVSYESDGNKKWYT